jgi:hypothetical protein
MIYFIIVILYFLIIGRKVHKLLPVLIILLPFQDVIVMILSNIPIINREYLRGILGIKEIFLILAVGLSIIQKRIKLISSLDKVFILIFIASCIYLVIPDTYFPFPNTFTAKVMGFRMSMIPTLLYFFGRGLRIDEKYLIKNIKLLIGISLFVYGFGIIEMTIIHREIFTAFLQKYGKPTLDSLRASSENADHFYSVSIGDRALYIRNIAGFHFPRLISVYLKPLGPAYASVFVLTLLGTMSVHKSKMINNPNIYTSIIFLALILTFTRAAIVAVFISFIVLFNLKKRARSLILLVLLFLLLSLFGSYTLAYISETVNAQDASTVAHIDAYFKGLEIIQKYPLGIGLGMSGPTSRLFGTNTGLGESLYITLLAERGAITFIMYVFLFTMLLTKQRYAIRVKGLTKTENLVLTATYLSTIAFLITSITTETWFGYTYAGVYWIFLGISIQISQKLTIRRVN